MRIINYLVGNDELNVYLVSNGLKPAGIIGLTPIKGLDDNLIIEKNKLKESIEHKYLSFKPDVKSEMTNYLLNNNLTFDIKKWTSKSCQKDDGEILNKTFYNGFNVFYANSDENLERLISSRKDNNGVGSALGFPSEAVDCFQKVINDELRDGSYLMVSMAKAKKIGIKLPSWVAYISYVPENLDFVNGNVSKSSEALGEKYQSFVRQNNPNLAEKVENEFRYRVNNLPTHWEKRADKGYDVYWRK